MSANMTKKEINFINRVKANNKKVVAQYFALYTENSQMKKCLITFTPADGRLATLIKIRQEFFKLLNRYKRHKDYLDLSIKYFSSIEFTSKSIPHIHIQLFFTNDKAIKKVYQLMTSSDYQNTHTNSISFAINNNLTFTYVIKDYLKFDYDLEKFKHHFTGVNFITSSQKSISNCVVRYLFNNLEFKTKNRYKEILEMIQIGLIIISKDKVDISKIKNKRVKFKSKIGVSYIYVFEKTNNNNNLNMKSMKHRIKIKRLKKSKKAKCWHYRIKDLKKKTT
jgi:hypothetical protein